MKKHLIILMSLFSSVSLFSQVGINTENPQQLFHTDGKSSAATTNPTTGTPTVAQQVDDVVITNQGRIGIGTIAPTEKLEVNGKTKINDLPVNGTGGFTATRTLVANNNGVVGVLNGLPPGAYDGYNLTGMQEYVSSNATSRNYTYNQIVSTNCHNADGTPNANSTMCYTTSGLSVNPSYSTTFNKASTSNDKYIFLSIDYSLRTPTIGNVVPSKSFWVNYDIEILINGTRAKIYSANYSIPSGASTTFDGNKIFTINLTGITINPTNNTLQIKLIPTRSLIKSNAGTAEGNFATGNATVMTTSVKDVSFFLYEK
ncbi:hypothetical protein EB1_35640 [Empedobacter brevis NBRC 14943 = ATCC 43319]|uniref:Uncharacterized protein n=1 Tax=Empedobacter brevis NBRC 14943 = ATCC 43319 TaxID=1218108 RepID=A0A511NLU3_9FLAO|nr:hypothetical protein [Empedobacter brevis]GEM53774.1 hypothetical protein EB1_35640 [Empedobacter brevis NBRC 14943 = ATCC 43319]